MGEVYRARDTRLDRTVAIKVLPRDLTSDSAARQRFEREARAILSGPTIMRSGRHIATTIWSGARLSAVLLLFAAGVARLDAAPKQPIVVKNVSVKVPDNIELVRVHPTQPILWVDVEFDLANIGRHSAILKNFRIYYRIPSDWHLGGTSPGFGFEASDSFIYSIDIGTIAPGQVMRRKQRIGIEPPYRLLKVNLHTLNSDEYPVVLKWRIDYLVENQLHSRQWCWMVDYNADVPRRCSIQPPGQAPRCPSGYPQR